MKVKNAFSGIRFLYGLLIFLLCLQYSNIANAVSFPPRPPSDSFYVDTANLITPESGKQINDIIFKLWHEKLIPIYVVTIPSLAQYDAADYSIEQYARALFDHWGIGSPKRNYGILLLISKNDRRARIELGAGYGHDYNAATAKIMQTLITPKFKTGDYANGILEGVRGLDAMARGQAIPSPEIPWWVLPAIIAFIVLAIAVIVSLFRSGRKGWGWALLIVLGAIIWFLLRNARSSRGGFGGGSSGGGGASGSW